MAKGCIGNKWVKYLDQPFRKTVYHHHYQQKKISPRYYDLYNFYLQVIVFSPKFSFSKFHSHALSNIHNFHGIIIHTKCTILEISVSRFCKYQLSGNDHFYKPEGKLAVEMEIRCFAYNYVIFSLNYLKKFLALNTSKYFVEIS